LAVRFNKFITFGYLMATENEVELLTTIFYNLHIVIVEKFHHKSVCHKIEGVQLRFVFFIQRMLLIFANLFRIIHAPNTDAFTQNFQCV